MKTKEFIRGIEELGFECEKGAAFYFIYDHEGNNYAAVSHATPYQISNMGKAWQLLDKDVQEKLFDLLVEYARTPIEDREEEKKFYLRHKFLTSTAGEITHENSFINYNTRDNEMYLADKLPIGSVKTIFTLKEIEEIKKKFNTDLADFELVEVEG